MFVMLHVSDLHLGDRMRWLGTFQPPGPRQPDPFPSQRGHDESVALQLTNEWTRMLKTCPDAKVVVSGDLTRTGMGGEFGLAHRFTHAYWLINPTSPLWLGLGQGGRSPVLIAGSPPFAWLGPDLRGYAALTIPGNHDFWTGRMWKVNRSVLEPHFWPLAWLYAYNDRSAVYEIHIVGLDSCSGLSGVSKGWNQFWAKGAIHAGQLTAAQQLFSDALAAANSKGRKVLRVVMVHHPPGRLTPASLIDLVAWLKQINVHVLLTGHTHVPSPIPQRDAQGNVVAGQLPLAPVPGTSTYELRCGTTLQAGTATHMPGPYPNHYFVHELSPSNAKGQAVVEWETSSHEHDGTKWVDTGIVFRHSFTLL